MRIIVVSNRLPVTVHITGETVSSQQSVGGLATGISSYTKRISDTVELLWVGWPGREIAPQLQERVRVELAKEHAAPVFVSQGLMDEFYDGFCNKTLWPLFHYVPSLVSYNEVHYQAYSDVNALFANALREIIRPGDVIWVNDYQLLLLPQMLRAQFPDLSIGFFLHIPFPAYELFQLLPKPWREALLRGVLGADLIGFHTYDYTQHFLRSVVRVLGLENKMGTVTLAERLVQIDTFPMGIDFERYHNAHENPRVAQIKQTLVPELHGQKVVLSIDRLDYSKGIPQRLLAYERFLVKYPQWREKITLAMVVVPSRIGVDHYQNMKKQLDELVGRINGNFSTVRWAPILYQYRALKFEELCAYYSLSDVALLTPLRDGMNLVAKEYVAARADRTGVLVLSEMTGAARELGEAIIVNPNDTSGVADAIKDALEMPLSEQKRRNALMQARLMRYDVVRWAEDFLATLAQVREKHERMRVRLLSDNDRATMLDSYATAKQRLLLLDYDGTLVHFSPTPEQAAPDEELLLLLRELANDAANTIIIISGRDRTTLESWFGTLPVGLIAEHGVYTRTKSGVWSQKPGLQCEWKSELRAIIERHVDRLPGAFIEEKDFSFAFHFRLADPELSSLRTKELLDDLTHFTANIDVQVLQGHKVIEVRCGGVNKGRAASQLVTDKGFILAIGDDWTDEDLFAQMPDEAFTIRVGFFTTRARYNTPSVPQVRKLLGDLAQRR